MKFYGCLLSVVLLTACSDDDVVSKAGNHTVEAEEFRYYLKGKGIRYEELSSQVPSLTKYTSNIALENAILDEEIIDISAIDVASADYRRNLIINKYFDEYLRKQVTEEAIQNYFANYASDYEDEKVHIAHILVRTNSAMTDEEKQTAKNKIHAIYSQLNAGADFDEVAKNDSEDRISAAKSGDLGWLKRGAISPVFSQQAFDTESGKYTKPVQTEFGYHIIKVLEPVTIVKRSFNDVKGEIRHQLLSKAKQAELDRLLKSQDIEIYEDVLSAVE